MNEHTFWVVIWSLAATVVMAITAATLHYYNNENLMMDQLIREGGDPMEISCAFETERGMSATCIALATRRVLND